MAGPAGLVPLHGVHGGAGLDVSWPVLLAATAVWAVIGGGLYWYYGRQTAEG